MVEYILNLDTIFGSLSDATRRNILQRVALRELTVSEIAEPYKLSLAAISKHLAVLEKARLIVKQRRGKQQIVSISPAAFKSVSEYIKPYDQMWADRFDALEVIINRQNAEKK